MSQQAVSPLVQQTQQPSLVISTLHAPMVRLQVNTVIPFIMQHKLHRPPAIMVHKFCIMVQAAASSQQQVIFIPPAHFSIFMEQRGTITMLGVAVWGADPICRPLHIPFMAVRSIIIALVIIQSPREVPTVSNPGKDRIPGVFSGKSVKRGHRIRKRKQEIVAFQGK